jgi:competence protein ComEA
MRPKKVELAVVAVTIAFVFFTAGYFVGRQAAPGAVALPPEFSDSAAPPGDGSAADALPSQPAAPLPAETEPAAPPTSAVETPAQTAPREKIDGKININAASLITLQELPRVGPAIAGRIIDYREANGDFKTTADIMNVRGIGEKTYENLKDLITVG